MYCRLLKQLKKKMCLNGNNRPQVNNQKDGWMIASGWHFRAKDTLLSYKEMNGIRSGMFYG